MVGRFRPRRTSRGRPRRARETALSSWSRPGEPSRPTKLDPWPGRRWRVGLPTRAEPTRAAGSFETRRSGSFLNRFAPTSVCGTFGPSGRSAWGCRGSGGDGFREAQDELVEIGGRRYRVHPAAVFPIMSGREFDELVEDVRVNGLREPVVVRGDQLVDGRNRVRACAAAGVVPEVRQLERGTDVASWVMSVNVHRRHLDASQRALLASRLSAL